MLVRGSAAANFNPFTVLIRPLAEFEALTIIHSSAAPLAVVQWHGSFGWVQHSKLTGTQRCGFLLLKDCRSMTVELGLAITFRFRNKPGVPLGHGPGSRGFKDLPWVALTIPKYHLVTRLSLSCTTAYAGSGSGPWSIPIWVWPTLKVWGNTTNNRFLSSHVVPGCRRGPALGRGALASAGRIVVGNKARLAISWPTAAINADPLPSDGQYLRVIGLVSPIGPGTPQAVGGSRQEVEPSNSTPARGSSSCLA